MAETGDRYAFVTLITSDAYLPGALALSAALKDVHPSPPVPPEVPFETVCLVTPETVDVSTIKLLRRVFDTVVGVEVIVQPDESNLRLLGRPDLSTVLTKLHVFRLMQYSKIVFLDADVLPLRPLSHLFSITHPFAAVPDVGWPDIFNSGVLVLSPSNDHFNDLQTLLKTKGSWDGGDQGILNEWRGNDWHRLSFTYNTTPSAAYTYAPAYKRFGSEISAIHFIGPNKPWHSIPNRAPGSSNSMLDQETEAQPAYHYSALVDRWFNVYDRHYRAHPLMTPELSFAPQRYDSAWDRGGTSQDREGNNGAPFTLDELRHFAVEGMIGSGLGLKEDTNGDGNYTVLPLEGRFDLMRPAAHKSDTRVEDSTSLEPKRADLSVTRQEPSLWETLHIPGPNEIRSTPVYHVWSSAHNPAPEHQLQKQWTNEHSYGPPSGGGEALFVGRMEFQQSEVSSVRFRSGKESQFGVQAHDHHPQFTGAPNHGQPYHERERHAERRPSFSRRRSSRSHLPHEQKSHSERKASENQRSASSRDEEREFYQHPGRRPMQEYNRRVTPSKLRHQHKLDDTGHREIERQPEKRSEKHVEQRRNKQAQNVQPHPPNPEHRDSQINDQPPERSHSPPLMSWDPAVEPPPTDVPQSFAFPSVTYFPNIWDSVPSKENDAPHQQPSPSGPKNTQNSHFSSKAMSPPQLPSSGSFFSPPQLPGIPEILLREGHYRNVTGDSNEGSSPHPDPSKVTRMFPWEEKSQHTPSRIFPNFEANSTLDESSRRGSPDNSPKDGDPPYFNQPLPPLLAGLPTSLTFANAWDSVPSITRYASRLSQPSPKSNTLAPPFEDGRWSGRRGDSFRSWEERTEAGSQDGDVEDEGEDDRTQDTLWEDDSDSNRPDSPSCSDSNTSTARDNKDYVTRGVQTATRETRSAATQVNPEVPVMLPKEVQTLAPGPTNPPPQTQRSWPTEGSLVPPMTSFRKKTLGADSSLMTAAPSSQLTPNNVTSSAPSLPSLPYLTRFVRSSSLSSAPALASANSAINVPRLQVVSQTYRSPSGPQKPNLTALANANHATSPKTHTRRFSADGPSNTSSPSLSPRSPQELALSNSVKIGGRHWDPARGVDLFKRSSEEVLARFLKMGSWEEGQEKAQEKVKDASPV